MNHVRAARVLSMGTAALLVVAAVRYALYIFGILAPRAPAYNEAISRAENIQNFFIYMQSVAGHELGFTVAAALAFLLIAPLGAILRKVFDFDSAWPTTAAVFFVVASCLLVAGQLVQIGTQRAILPVSMDEVRDPEVLGLIWDIGVMTSNWLENGGYFSLALGMLGWAIVGRTFMSEARGWIILSVVLAGSLFVVVSCQALEIWAIYDIALSLSGAVLAPAWFLMTARICSSEARVE